MKAKELVKNLMVEQEMTNAKMASALGVSQATLWDRLNPKNSKNMTSTTLNTMLSQLGYELVAKEKDGNKEYVLSE